MDLPQIPEMADLITVSEDPFIKSGNSIWLNFLLQKERKIILF
jgi:hypothetical protein